MSTYRNGRLELTMPEWKALHRDFKGTMREDGKIVRTALHFVPGVGTSIVPVVIVKEDPAVAFARHRAEDPHCTCNDCLAFHAAQTAEPEPEPEPGALYTVNGTGHFSWDEARARAGRIFDETGVVVEVRAIRRRPDAGIVAADRAFRRSQNVED